MEAGSAADRAVDRVLDRAAELAVVEPAVAAVPVAAEAEAGQAAVVEPEVVVDRVAELAAVEGQAADRWRRQWEARHIIPGSDFHRSRVC